MRNYHDHSCLVAHVVSANMHVNVSHDSLVVTGGWASSLNEPNKQTWKSERGETVFSNVFLVGEETAAPSTSLVNAAEFVKIRRFTVKPALDADLTSVRYPGLWIYRDCTLRETARQKSFPLCEPRLLGGYYAVLYILQ